MSPHWSETGSVGSTHSICLQGVHPARRVQGQLRILHATAQHTSSSRCTSMVPKNPRGPHEPTPYLAMQLLHAACTRSTSQSAAMA